MIAPGHPGGELHRVAPPPVLLPAKPPGGGMRIGSLDGVRALLALWVVFGHLAGTVGARVPLVDNPAVAVDLFMVLSGFFIAATYGSLAAQHPPAVAMRYFWVRRVMRIWPVYAVLLTLVWVFIVPLHELRLDQLRAFASTGTTLPAADPAPITLANALMHYTMLFGVWPSFATATALPDWSLSLEFQFYLLFPLLALALRQRPLLLCFAAAALAFIAPPLLGHYLDPGRFAHFRQPAFLPYRLHFFLVGALAFAMFRRQRDAADAFWTVELLAIVLCLSVMGVQASMGIFGVLYLMARPHSQAARLLSHPTMRWLGRISFSIYLVHAPLMRLVVGMLAHEPWFVALPPIERYAVALACLLPLVLAAAQLLYRLVELPGIDLAHRWTSGPSPAPKADSDGHFTIRENATRT